MYISKTEGFSNIICQSKTDGACQGQVQRIERKIPKPRDEVQSFCMCGAPVSQEQPAVSSTQDGMSRNHR